MQWVHAADGMLHCCAADHCTVLSCLNAVLCCAVMPECCAVLSYLKVSLCHHLSDALQGCITEMH